MWTASSRTKKKRSWRCERPACARIRGADQRTLVRCACAVARARDARARPRAAVPVHGHRRIARRARCFGWRSDRARAHVRGLQTIMSATVVAPAQTGQRLRQELSLKRVAIGLLIAALGVGSVFARPLFGLLILVIALLSTVEFSRLAQRAE